MADKRCTISLVVNGHRWLEEGEALAAQRAVPRSWSLGGLQDYARLLVGAKLGYTLENAELVEQRWCRAKSIDADSEAVDAGFTVVNAPHVTADDAGAGLSLEAVEAVAASDSDIVVLVGHSMNWMPLRQKLQSRSVEFFELLLPPAGKVVVSTERVIDLREMARRQHAESPVSALFKLAPRAAAATVPYSETASQSHDESFAANAVRGVVKSLAKGYGIVTRRDGLGDVQFLATHVSPPGFEFIEVGDELRFDVVQVASGKWLAQRVVRS